MADFSPIYTGKGSAVTLPDLDKTEKAISRSGELQIRGEEMKLEKSLRDKERLVANMKVDPVELTNDILMNRQALLMEQYNNKAGQLYYKSGGNLTISDELELASMKNKLTTQQSKLKAQEGLAQQMLGIINKDVKGFYNKQVFEDRYRKWLTDPEKNPLDQSALRVAPQDILQALSTHKIKGTPDMDTDIQVKTDPTGKQTRWATDYATVMTRDEAKKVIPQIAMSNEAYLMDVIERFDNADPQEQIKYLKQYDGDGDGIIDPAEMRKAKQGININHPILKWASENPDFINATMQRVPKGGATEVKESKGGSEGDNTKVKMGGQLVGYQPTEKQSFRKYTTYHPVSKWPTQNIPTQDITVQKPDGEKVRITEKTLALELTGYDENTDEFTFLTNSNYYPNTNPSLGSGDQIAISRSKLPHDFANFEILVNGKKVKVGELTRKQPSTEPGVLDNL